MDPTLYDHDLDAVPPIGETGAKAAFLGSGGEKSAKGKSIPDPVSAFARWLADLGLADMIVIGLTLGLFLSASPLVLIDPATKELAVILGAGLSVPLVWRQKRALGAASAAVGRRLRRSARATRGVLLSRAGRLVGVGLLGLAVPLLVVLAMLIVVAHLGYPLTVRDTMVHVFLPASLAVVAFLGCMSALIPNECRTKGPLTPEAGEKAGRLGIGVFAAMIGLGIGTAPLNSIERTLPRRPDLQALFAGIVRMSGPMKILAAGTLLIVALACALTALWLAFGRGDEPVGCDDALVDPERLPISFRRAKADR